ncbi:DUF554 domain-containing protein [Klebsiella pneumoniae]|uniref:DUF554 domain-containing protein n=1 Tax=Klebsiella pneumoniae TaxID=573 RepID=UPI00073C8889|nr:DUF554 domain-containing protein [Klebsiella pneumoniae]KSW35973.1 hypothetical protein APT65_13430 [Klebsiella pneumoniae]MCD5722642.1 DUF554 domain-containing protein [Klebsiella pneumoniae]MCI8181075.1 DUF554 domain-containing protein [Klebsiella pneumoniae]MCL7649623.1 DUF554 domain-containing protein [Klebsiella pneumoniae]MCM6466734.1 DUF554 domain-containing protein [Klebsiella pneumoniae]
MAIGIFVCSGSLLVGALAGASLNRFIPEHFKKTLPLIAGLISISMGIFFVNKLHNLPPIALAIIAGTIIGGLLNIEKWIERAGTTLRSPIERIFPAQSSASGTGIFGALTEGMTGDPTILLTKSILDFFTAAIFASTLGYIITVIFIPQLIVFVILFFAATFIMALINPSMIADFTACGGIIMLATGFRLCGIRAFPTANMLPSLILVMPFSAAWQQFIA